MTQHWLEPSSDMETAALSLHLPQVIPELSLRTLVILDRAMISALLDVSFQGLMPHSRTVHSANTMVHAGLPSSKHLIQIGGLGSGLDFNE